MAPTRQFNRWGVAIKGRRRVTAVAGGRCRGRSTMLAPIAIIKSAVQLGLDAKLQSGGRLPAILVTQLLRGLEAAPGAPKWA